MDIVNRLKFFLDQQGLTSSQFADACRIPRPTLSQLLTGRNKKVSDEIFAKIHDAYPQLSILWLMFGEGQPVTGAGPSGSVATQGGASGDTASTPTRPSGDFRELGSSSSDTTSVSPGTGSRGMIDFGNSLFDSDPTDFASDQPVSPNSQSGGAATNSHPLSQLGAMGAAAPANAIANGTNSAAASETQGTISISPDSSKKITSIVVFYNDNSFQSFAPTA